MKLLKYNFSSIFKPPSSLRKRFSCIVNLCKYLYPLFFSPIVGHSFHFPCFLPTLFGKCPAFKFFQTNGVSREQKKIILFFQKIPYNQRNIDKSTHCLHVKNNFKKRVYKNSKKTLNPS